MAAAGAEEITDESPDDIIFDDHVMRLELHPSSNIIASSTVAGTVTLHQYELSGNKKLAEMKHHDQSCRALRFTADGGTLFTGSTDASIGAYDLNAGKLSAVLANAHESAISSLLVLDEKSLASGDEDGVIKIWDLRQQKCCHELTEHEDFISDMTLASDDKTLLVAGSDGYLSVWNRKNGKLLAMSDQMEDEFLSVAIVKNGRKVVCGTQSGVLGIFSWGNWGDMTDRFPGHPQSVESMVKIDEDTLVTCSEDGIIRVVQVLPNKLLVRDSLRTQIHFRAPLGSPCHKLVLPQGVIGEHDGYPIEHIDLSHDAQYLASCSHDSTVKFWQVGYLFDDDEDGAEMDPEGAEEEQQGESGDVNMGSDSDDSDDEPPRKGKKGKGKTLKKNPGADFYADM